jgi:hypothetical protein
LYVRCFVTGSKIPGIVSRAPMQKSTMYR